MHGTVYYGIGSLARTVLVRRAMALVGLVGMAATLSGCVVATGRPCCYYHPHPYNYYYYR